MDRPKTTKPTNQQQQKTSKEKKLRISHTIFVSPKINKNHITATVKDGHKARLFLLSQVTIITDLLCIHVVPIHKETDAAVLHDAGTVEDQHQVVPLSFLRQLWTPEPHSVVAQSRVLLKFTPIACTNSNESQCYQSRCH